MAKRTRAAIDAPKLITSGPAAPLLTFSWPNADPLAIVDGLPWRTFPWYLGQRNYAGTYWCATECSDVNYEWRLELSRLRQSRVPSSSRHCNPTDSVTWARASVPSSAK